MGKRKGASILMPLKGIAVWQGGLIFLTGTVVTAFFCCFFSNDHALDVFVNRGRQNLAGLELVLFNIWPAGNDFTSISVTDTGDCFEFGLCCCVDVNQLAFCGGFCVSSGFCGAFLGRLGVCYSFVFLGFGVGCCCILFGLCVCCSFIFFALASAAAASFLPLQLLLRRQQTFGHLPLSP